jgi:O-antigen/teichoic acid export membrane protein
MENVNKALFWNISIVRHVSRTQLVLIVGIALVILLSGLIIFNPTLGVASALLLFLIVLVVPRPALIVYGLIVLLPLTAGLARGGAIPFLRLGQALLVVGFIFLLLSKPTRIGKSRLTAIDLIFVLFFLCEAVFPVLALYYRGEHLNLNSTGAFNEGTPLQTLLGPLQYYVLYRIVVAIIYTEKQITTVLKLSFVTSIIVSVIGILQALIPSFKKVLDLYYPPVIMPYSYDAYGVRATSTMLGYTALASYLTAVIIVVLACYTIQKKLTISPLLLTTTLLIDSMALLLTGTFAGYFGLAAGAAVVFILLRRIPKWIIYVLAGAALAIIIFQPFISGRLSYWIGGTNQGLFPTYGSRITLWKEVFLPAVGKYFLFGAGPAPAALSIWPTEETEYLSLLLRGGLPYFFSYFVLMGVAMVTCWRQFKSKGNEAIRTVAIATLAILVAINIMNVSSVYFSYPGVTQTFWTLLAMIVASKQSRDLGLSTSDEVITDRRWIRVRIAPDSSPSIATTPDAGAPRFGSYNSVSNVNEAGIAAPDQYHQRFASRARILDWRFVKDSVVVGAGSTIARALGLLFWVLLAHLLNPDDVGFVRYSITLAGILAIAATSGPTSISRFLAANRDDQQARDRYFSNGLVGAAVLLPISLFVSVLGLWLLHELNLGTILCIVGLSGFSFYFALARGMNNAWKMGLTYLLSNTVQMVLIVVVLGLFGLRTPTVALMVYGLTFLSPFILELFRPSAFRFRPSLISKSTLLELARFAIPVVSANAVYTIWIGTDILLVQNFIPHAAGSYAAAKTLASAFLFIPSAITVVLMPRVAKQGLSKSKSYTAGAILATFVLCLFGLVIVAVWGHELIALTFGRRYSDAYLPLVVMCAGMGLYSVYILLEAFIVGRGRPIFAVTALSTALVSTGITGLWLTPSLGMLGASFSFYIGAALGTTVMLFNAWYIMRKEKRLAGSELSNTSKETF